MKIVIAILLLAIALVTGVIWLQVITARCEAREPSTTRGGNPGTRVPVVVELFTSEGCSSCPPADRLLGQLESEQPVEGAEIIVLGEHVDYWDRLGWKDPFSSAEFTARQNGYAAAFGNDGMYTPQMVVDGREEFVGSDARRARNAIAAAARVPKAKVELTRDAGENGRELKLRVRVGPLPAGTRSADVLLGLTESGLVTAVPRGENAGRTIAHAGVVRQLQVIGQARESGAEAFVGQALIKLENAWRAENLRIVAFLQERGSRRIVGAASLRFAP